METTALLFSLLRHAVCGEELNKDTIRACSPASLEEVYMLAKKHDLAHLIAHATEDLDIPECDVLKKLQKAKLTAIYRYAKLDYELNRICQTLENAEIPFIPLKGSVLRQYYPEPWMRSSSDIDILVRETDLARAGECLESVLGYRNTGRAYHDIPFQTPSGILLELHFLLTEESSFPKAHKIVNSVWDYSVPVMGRQYHRQLPGEIFYLHHLLHMGYHLNGNGCGIRFILDDHIIRHGITMDLHRCDALLEECQLMRFSDSVTKLAQVWFSDREHNTLTEAFEVLILSGGVFGSLQNGVMVRQAKYGGQFQVIWHKIIMPYDQLKGLYPILRKQKWLTPFCQVLRWLRLLSPKRLRRSVVFLNTNMQISNNCPDYYSNLMKEIGL